MLRKNSVQLYWYIIGSLRPGVAYIRQQTGPPLVNIMACHLIGTTKRLTEPLLFFVDWIHDNFVKYQSKYDHCRPGKSIWKCRLQSGGFGFKVVNALIVEMNACLI